MKEEIYRARGLFDPPEDPLYPLLIRFTDLKDVAIPTVTLAEEDLDDLRRLLIKWEAGEEVEQEILNKYRFPDDPDIVA